MYRKKILVVFTKYDFKLFLLISLVPESQVNTSADPRPSTACDVISLTIKDNLVIYLLQGQRRRSVLKRGGGGGASFPMSHTHTPTQIFQTALCVVRWHKQSLHSV